MSRLDRQNRAPKVSVLPDLRLRVEEVWDVQDFEAKTVAKFLADVELPWGTQNDQYPDTRLILQNLTGQVENPAKRPNDPPPQLVRVYEQISATLETQVGNAEVDFDQYGRKTVILNFLQFSGNAPTYQVVGTTAAPAPNAACILKIEERTNDGTLQRIKRTYIDSGELSDTEELKFGGKLLLRSITSLNEIPSTPAGWTLVTTSTEFIEGLPVYRYQFANGSVAAGAGGVIDTKIEYEISPDQGVTGITRQTIKYISDPSVVVNPITTPPGYVLLSVDRQVEDGYVIWTAEYATGTGTVEFNTEIRNQGKLYIYNKTSLNVAPTAPPPTIGGTVVLIRNQQRNGTRVENGTIVYERTWAEGLGLVSESIHTRTDGLREVTWVSLGTKSTPTGVIIRDDYDERDGYRMFTVTAMQGDDGTTPVASATISFQRYVPFMYPGRAKAYTEIFGIYTTLDVFASPPVSTPVLATISVSYQTTNTLGIISPTFWNPSEWATKRSQWIGLGPSPYNLVEAMPGYRSTSSTPVSATASAFAPNNLSIFSRTVYGATTATIKVTGGPSSPDNQPLTLHADLEPAFTDVNGVTYYRKTRVTATIPAQAALPV